GVGHRGETRSVPPEFPPSGADRDGLLPVLLDLARRAGPRLPGVAAELLLGPPLAQQVPALVQGALQLPDAVAFGRAEPVRAPLPEVALLGDELPDALDDLRLAAAAFAHVPMLGPPPRAKQESRPGTRCFCRSLTVVRDSPDRSDWPRRAGEDPSRP